MSNDTGVLSNHNRRSKLDELVCDGLHYCCVWKFLKSHTTISSELIADRLGIHSVTVRRAKQSMKDRELLCEKRDNCMKRIGGKSGKRFNQ